MAVVDVAFYANGLFRLFVCACVYVCVCARVCVTIVRTGHILAKYFFFKDVCRF